MGKIKYFSLVFLSVCLFGLILLTSFQIKNKLDDIKDLIAPPPHIEHLSAGARYQMADLLWVRAFQDFDYCEVKLAKNLCKGNAWLSKMLLSIVALDPDYKVVYRKGALALSVLVSDYPGASTLFDLGVARFPNDWQLLFAAAFHASFEEKDNVKAALLYKQAGENGAPAWTYALAARLFTNEGQIEMGEKLIEELKAKDTDKIIIKRVEERLEEFKRNKK